MGIALRRAGLCVSQQFSDDRQAKSSAGGDRRIRMAKIMKTEAFETRAARDEQPGTLEVTARLAPISTGENMITGAGQF